jgi:hypothetical protein
MTHNVFACLVHEAPDCVADLVANLRCLDPDSAILLYDGSALGDLLDGMRWLDAAVLVVPDPRPMQWGRLHDFALDCMRFALATLDFDALTIVDSDQLLIRAGYSERLRQALADHPTAGCFGAAAGPLGRGTHIYPAAQAWAERDRWMPYLRERFPTTLEQFPHWSFWPTTAFSAEACRRLTDSWEDPDLRRLADASQITATEEVLLPTFTAMTGLDVVRMPLKQDLVRFRRSYRIADLERAATHPDAFWLHPVPRKLDDSTREWVRRRFHRYAYHPGRNGYDPSAPPSDRVPTPPGLVSYLMTTADRPRQAAFAVRQWELQEQRERELVIVDDGDSPIEELVAGCSRITYLRPAVRSGWAATRNHAAAHAQGEFFAHWDDSGWSSPARITDQLRALAESDADLCGRRAVLGYDPTTGSAWTYEYPKSRRLWLADATLLYRRAIWDAKPFSESTPKEQLGYCWPARARTAVAMTGLPSQLIALESGTATGPWWRPHSFDALPEVLGPDWAAYREACGAS